MRIESFKTEPDRTGRYWVTFSDGQRLGLYRQTVEDFGLYPGRELTEEEWRRLQESVGRMSAKMRAVRIVAASSVSKKDLQQRLVQKGESPEDAANAVAWMEDMHLVDDAETARQVVSRCIAKGYGLQRAKQALYEKKIPKKYHVITNHVMVLFGRYTCTALRPKCENCPICDLCPHNT